MDRRSWKSCAVVQRPWQLLTSVVMLVASFRFLHLACDTFVVRTLLVVQATDATSGVVRSLGLTVENDDRRQLQRKIYRGLKSATLGGAAARTIAARASRWLVGPVLEHDIRVSLSDRLRRVCDATRCLAIVWAVVRILCRGVATARRFQNKLGPCVFGCGACGDSLEHMTWCPVLVHGVTLFIPPLANMDGIVQGMSLNWQCILLLEGDNKATANIAAAVIADCIIARTLARKT